MKILIVYFSFTENVHFIAETIKKELNADTLRIFPVEKREPGAKAMFLGGFEAMMKKKPTLDPYEIDLSPYDLILFGFPIWNWRLTPPIRTFIDKEFENIKDKKIALFSSSDGNGIKGMKRSMEFMKEIGLQIIGNFRVISPLTKNTEEQKQKAIDWVRSLN